MNADILNNIPYSINEQQVLSKLRLINEDAADIERALLLINEARSIGNPKAVYKTAYVDSRGEDFVIIEGIKFNSRVMCVNLSSIHKVIAYVVTAGTELEEWEHSISDIFEKYWADTITQLILRDAFSFLNKKIKSDLAIKRITRMSPGSIEDWPVDEQPKLFQLIGNPEESIGVHLTDSFLMLPTKSISGILFPTETGYENCQLCPRENCPGRSTLYNKNLYEERYR